MDYNTVEIKKKYDVLANRNSISFTRPFINEILALF
jgi:hypothetical protein